MNCEICRDPIDTPHNSGGLIICGECYEIECEFYEDMTGDPTLATAADEWCKSNAG